MADLIDRKAMLNHIEKIRQDALMIDNIHESSIIMMGMNLCEKAVMNQPSLQPERKKGKWVGSDSQCGIACSVCGVSVDDFCCSTDYIDMNYQPNFCPNCGARMEGDHHE